MDDDNGVETARILCRLLTAMSPEWVIRLVEALEKVTAETGHGEVDILIYRGRVKQINRVHKER